MNWHHIFEREVIHLFAAPGVFLIAFHAVDYFFMKWYTAWSQLFWIRFIVPGIFALLVIFLREPADVALAGDWFGKSYIDLVTWVAGIGIGIWGVYRTIKRFSAQAVSR